MVTNFGKADSTIAVDPGEEVTDEYLGAEALAIMDAPEAQVEPLEEDETESPTESTETAPVIRESASMLGEVLLPTLGRIVHFNHPSGKTVAAVVTDVPEVLNEYLEIELCLLVSSGISFVNALYSDLPTLNCWTWPPRT